MSVRTLSARTMFFGLAVVCMALALIVVWAMVVFNGTQTESSALIFPLALAALVILWLPAVVARIRQRLDLFEAIHVQALAYTLFYVVPFAYIAANPKWDQIRLVPYYPQTMLIMMAGFAALIAGYYFPLGPRLAQLRSALGKVFLIRPPASGRLPEYVRAASAVGWVSRVMLFATGSYFQGAARSSFQSTSSWYSPLEQLSVLASLAVAYALIAWFRSPHGKLSWQAGLLLTAELAWTLPSGQRAPALNLAIIAAVVLWYVRRRIPRALLLLAAVVIPLFFATAHLSRARIAAAYTRSASIGIEETIEAWQGGFRDLRTGGDVLDNTLGITMSRLADGNSLARIISKLPAVSEWQYGLTYAQGFLSASLFWVPRFVWPAKPSAVVVTSEFMKTFYPEVLNSEAPLTMLGEHYWNFGFAGVLIGMFIWGVILRVTYLFCAPLEARDNIAGLLAYCQLAPALATPSTLIASYLTVFARLILYLCLLSFAAKWIDTRQQRAERAIRRP